MIDCCDFFVEYVGGYGQLIWYEICDVEVCSVDVLIFLICYSVLWCFKVFFFVVGMVFV